MSNSGFQFPLSAFHAVKTGLIKLGLLVWKGYKPLMKKQKSNSKMSKPKLTLMMNPGVTVVNPKTNLPLEKQKKLVLWIWRYLQRGLHCNIFLCSQFALFRAFVWIRYFKKMFIILGRQGFSSLPRSLNSTSEGSKDSCDQRMASIHWDYERKKSIHADTELHWTAPCVKLRH